MNVLVTGGSGFLGEALCASLERLGHEVHGVTSGGSETSLEERLQAFQASLTQAPRADVVYHLAGTGSASLSAASHHFANLETTRVLAGHLRSTGHHGPVVFASSASVYGETGPHPISEDHPARPCSLMGASKLAAEACLQDALGDTCKVRIARMFSVFGPGQSKLVVYEFARRIVAAAGPVILPGGQGKVRDFLSLKEVIRALLWLGMDSPGQPQPLIVNLCSGQPLTIEKLAHHLLNAWGSDPTRLQWEPEELALTAAACVGSPERLRRLGFTPVGPTREDYRETLEWCARISSAVR